MLTYFPSPYPGEWWYSALCRYHVRSGHTKQQTTIKELFGGHPRAAMGTLFPNCTVHQIISQLPSSWDCRNIILHHTLFPYYVRMYPLEQKAKMLETLCRGESVSLTHIWKATTKKAWSLRYCPACVRADMEKYGEAYWHREHQLPLAMVCCVHNCRLQCAGEPDPRLNEAFYPLSQERIADVAPPEKSWCETLSRAVSNYLTLPLEAGPTADHNNLAQALMNKGYGIIQSSQGLSLDAPRLYQDLTEKYGLGLIKETFGNEVSAFVLNRIVKWNLTSPERYIILQDFAGLSTETVFSTKSIEDRLYARLKELAATGVIYGKQALAEQLGLKSFQIDRLARKYGIAPFWERNGAFAEKKGDMIKLYLTTEERRAIHKAAQELGFRYDGHFVKYCVEKALQNYGQ